MTDGRGGDTNMNNGWPDPFLPDFETRIYLISPSQLKQSAEIECSQMVLDLGFCHKPIDHDNDTNQSFLQGLAQTSDQGTNVSESSASSQAAGTISFLFHTSQIFLRTDQSTTKPFQHQQPQNN